MLCAGQACCQDPASAFYTDCANGTVTSITLSEAYFNADYHAISGLLQPFKATLKEFNLGYSSITGEGGHG